MSGVKKPSKKDIKIAHLEKELLQYKSMDLLALANAHRELQKLNRDNYLASGVIVTIQNLGGAVKVGPVMIQDGLSQQTIDALVADVERTYTGRIEHPITKIHPKKEPTK